MFSLKKLSPTITDMIRFDHSHVMVTFHQYTSGKQASVRKALADTICTAVAIHATLEEEIFYPVLRELGGADEVMRKSAPEHDDMRRVIAELRATDAADDKHASLLHQLMRDVMHHVADEETVLLPLAEQRLSKERLDELGAQMTKRRLELAAPEAGKIARDTVVGFSRSTAAVVAGVAGVAGAVFAVRALAARRHA